MTRVVARAINDPVQGDALPKPSPPQPPPPKQPAVDSTQDDTMEREMEQAMAIVRAKNAAGTVLSTEAPIAKERMIGVLGAEEPRGPVPVIKPPPTSSPKVPPRPFFTEPYRSDDDEPAWTAPRSKPPPDWEAKTAEAARKARAVIAKAKEVLGPTETPHYKPPPKGFGPQKPKGKPPPPCPVLGAIASINGEGPLPPPPAMKSPPDRNSARVPAAEKAAMDRAKARQGKSPSKGFVENYVNQVMEQANVSYQDCN
eukprot:5817399-Amphidinium_carterae.1